MAGAADGCGLGAGVDPPNAPSVPASASPAPVTTEPTAVPTDVTTPPTDPPTTVPTAPVTCCVVPPMVPVSCCTVPLTAPVAGCTMPPTVDPGAVGLAAPAPAPAVGPAAPGCTGGAAVVGSADDDPPSPAPDVDCDEAGDPARPAGASPCCAAASFAFELPDSDDAWFGAWRSTDAKLPLRVPATATPATPVTRTAPAPRATTPTTAGMPPAGAVATTGN